ncbi:hypothetical protein Arash_gp85c [Salmonella phage Arash]|nr:hypothetical protein Arash_gp85c [Salmonella phage Arash]
MVTSCAQGTGLLLAFTASATHANLRYLTRLTSRRKLTATPPLEVKLLGPLTEESSCCRTNTGFTHSFATICHSSRFSFSPTMPLTKAP